MDKKFYFYLFLIFTTMVFNSCGINVKEETIIVDNSKDQFSNKELENFLANILLCDSVSINQVSANNYKIKLDNPMAVIDSVNSSQGIASIAFMIFMENQDKKTIDNLNTIDVDVITKGEPYKINYDKKTYDFMVQLSEFSTNYALALINNENTGIYNFFNEDFFTKNDIQEIFNDYKSLKDVHGEIVGHKITGIYFNEPNDPLSSSEYALRMENQIGKDILVHEFMFLKGNEIKISRINYSVREKIK